MITLIIIATFLKVDGFNIRNVMLNITFQLLFMYLVGFFFSFLKRKIIIVEEDFSSLSKEESLLTSLNQDSTQHIRSHTHRLSNSATI